GVHEWSSARLERLRRRSTGHALVVCRNLSPRQWDLGLGSEWTLSLGSIGSGERAESIPMSNGGSSPLKLLAAESSCSCVLDVQMRPATVPPGVSGVLQVRIRGSALSAAITRQQVRLEFGG